VIVVVVVVVVVVVSSIARVIARLSRSRASREKV
jgi:hypothetical protein